MSSRVKPGQQTLRTLLDEATAQARTFLDRTERLQRAERGSDAYEEAEADLAVEASWLRMKLEALESSLSADE